MTINYNREIFGDGKYWETNYRFVQDHSKSTINSAIKLLGDIQPESILDIGYGSGLNLRLLCDHYACRGVGCDVSEGSIRIAQQYKTPSIEYRLCSIEDVTEKFHIATMFDVFEHVDDYIGFLRKCHDKSEYFLFNIPIDMFVLGVLIDYYMTARKRYGHLHYFSKKSALATLEYAGYKIVKYKIVDSSWMNFKDQPGILRFIVLLLQLTLNVFSKDLKVKLLGSSSLLVLAQ